MCAWVWIDKSTFPLILYGSWRIADMYTPATDFHEPWEGQMLSKFHPPEVTDSFVCSEQLPTRVNNS